MDEIESEKSERELRKEEQRRKKNEKFLSKQKQQKEKPIFSDKKETSKSTIDIIKYEIPTKIGDIKDIVVPMPNSYSPLFVEACWYEWWSKSGYFKPMPNINGNKFVICLPPPNVTGNLHLGHALTTSIQDCLIRWHRMNGHDVLWIPGTDHAGIATQVVVEKQLKKELPNVVDIKKELGRQKFVDKIWEWKEQKGHLISEQEKALGASIDWSREFFTMDKNFSSAVTEAFVRLFDEGLIYRSNRLVNWSCALKSAISDIEVEKKEFAGRTVIRVANYDKSLEVGTLAFFAYPIIDKDNPKNMDEEIVVATTRLETMLGDTGIAVNPKDPRYSKYFTSLSTSRDQSGCPKYQISHPFFAGRIMKLVLDDAVDIEFGTGAVKITPAHDFDDFEIGKRHNLESINIFTDDGRMNENCGPFTGIHRFEVRALVEKKLNELGLFREKRDHSMVIPFCSRSKDIVEPLLKPQWYVDCNDMAKKACEAVASGELQLIPPIHEKTWYNWMSNIRDWCVSRQLWWGHRIPAYKVIFTESENAIPIYAKTCDKLRRREGTVEEIWVSARDSGEAESKAKDLLGISLTTTPYELRQDEDVLDTWFSSALAPFASLGWPNTESPDFKRFFPNTLLETGHDILFFWVARMVFMSQKLVGKLPFTQVYLHAMVRDSHGRKMSKSLGNIIDPIDVIHGITLQDLNEKLLAGNLDVSEIEKAKQGQKKDYPNGIPECGTDALRFALAAYTSQGRDINLDVLRIVGYRHFCNKIWNSAKFILSTSCNLSLTTTQITLGEKNGDNGTANNVNSDCIRLVKTFKDYSDISDGATNVLMKEMDLWILQMLSATVFACNTGFKNFDFPAITTALFNFWLYQFCDIYIEYAKLILYDKIATNPGYKQSVLDIMVTCLYTFLKLLHPLMPFLTEELYQRLKRHLRKDDEQIERASISISAYPKDTEWEMDKNDHNLNSSIDFIMNVIKGIRNVRHEYNIPKQILNAKIYINTRGLGGTSQTINFSNPSSSNTEYSTFLKRLTHLRDFVEQSTNLSKFETVTQKPEPHLQKHYTSFIVTAANNSEYSTNFTAVVYVSLEGIIELEKEKQKLQDKVDKSKELLETLLINISDPNYTLEKVGEKIYELNKNKFKQYENEIREITNRLNILNL